MGDTSNALARRASDVSVGIRSVGLEVDRSPAQAPRSHHPVRQLGDAATLSRQPSGIAYLISAYGLATLSQSRRTQAGERNQQSAHRSH